MDEQESVKIIIRSIILGAALGLAVYMSFEEVANLTILTTASVLLITSITLGIVFGQYSTTIKEEGAY